MEPAARPRTCVVVSYWNGRPDRNLRRLLRQMQSTPAGAHFDALVVCNGGDRSPLRLTGLGGIGAGGGVVPTILNRPNEGYNIGAWEAGRRHAPGCTYYLFLQDECFIKRPGWVSEFEYRFDHDPGLGLLGESIMWDQMSWPYIRAATDRDLGPQVWAPGDTTHPLDQYLAFLDQRGIPKGQVGTHLQSLVLFTSARVLDEIGGLPCGGTYREAVACEIGLSRAIAARGYRIAKVKDEPFFLIGHRQWSRGHQRYTRVRKVLAAAARRIGLKRK